VERWWPQDRVLPHATALVAHGGFGTTLAGLRAGLPMVIVPLFSMDQFANARQLQATGVGIALENGPDVAARVSEALTRILSDPAYRATAGRMADEVAQLPLAAECASVLATLIGNDQP
jgi:UDP:flavonoid glycosyltransferase YjiC (YdhE family)